MIHVGKPKSESHDVIFIRDIFSSNGNNHDLYFIEDVVQRPYAWKAKDIRELVSEFFFLQEMICKGSKSAALAYVDFGDIQVSELEPYNKTEELNALEKQGIGIYSEIDGSQRCRTYLVLYIVLLMLKEKESGQGETYFDLENLKNGFDRFKFYGIDTQDLSDLYDFIAKTKINKILKDNKINTMENKFENGKEKDNLISLLFYVIYLVNDAVSDYLDGGTLTEADMEAPVENQKSVEDAKINFIDCSIKTLLNRVYGHQAVVPYVNKYDKFNDLNAKGEPIEDKERIPRILLNTFQDVKEELYGKFVKLRELCKTCEDEKRFVPGRSFKDCIILIMVEAFKILLLKNHRDDFEKQKVFKQIFSSKYDLDNVKYGLKTLIDKKIVFKNSDELFEYFDMCIDMAEFVLNDSFTKHNDKYNDYFYFQNYSGDKCVWQYFIKPLYILHKSNYTYEEKEEIKDLLYRTCYLFYTLTKGFNNTTNVQSLINAIEDISRTMIENSGSTVKELKTNINVLIYHFQELNSFNWADYLTHLGGISYVSKTERGVIKRIMIAMEYFLCKKYSLSTDVLYQTLSNWKNPDYDLDHIKPKSLLNEPDNTDEVRLINSLGNIALLENTLNERKGDNMKKNSSLYVQSKFICTKLLCNDFYGEFNNIDINDIKNETCVVRLSEEDLNEKMTNEMINMRRDAIATFICQFMKPDYRY
jgi:hypothetical protein